MTESLSVVFDSATPWTVQSVEFSSQNAGVGRLSLLQGGGNIREKGVGEDCEKQIENSFLCQLNAYPLNQGFSTSATLSF